MSDIWVLFSMSDHHHHSSFMYSFVQMSPPNCDINEPMFPDVLPLTNKMMMTMMFEAHQATLCSFMPLWECLKLSHNDVLQKLTYSFLFQSKQLQELWYIVLCAIEKKTQQKVFIKASPLILNWMIRLFGIFLSFSKFDLIHYKCKSIFVMRAI